MDPQSQVNFLEIIGRLYVQNSLLERKNWELNELLRKEVEEHKQLIDLSQRLSMPSSV